MNRYFGILLLSLSVSAYGALNKWVDSEGKVHYSDEPPPSDVTVQPLAIPSVASGVPAQKSIAEREAEWKKAKKEREEAAQNAAQQQEEALAKQKNCAGAKANLQTLESGMLITTFDEKGERVNMDDAARQQGIEDARKQISEYCN